MRLKQNHEEEMRAIKEAHVDQVVEKLSRSYLVRDLLDRVKEESIGANQ